jgi:hypothetical protein
MQRCWPSAVRRGSEYSFSKTEDSMKVEVLGYEVEGIGVVIDYNLTGY